MSISNFRKFSKSCCWPTVLFQGFESRGTDISNKLSTWENLLDSISHVGPLTTNPIQPVTAAKREKNRRRNRKRKKNKRQKRETSSDSSIILNKGENNIFQNITFSILDPLHRKTKTGRWKREEASPVYSSEHRAAWLCGDPSKNIRVIFGWGSCPFITF